MRFQHRAGREIPPLRGPTRHSSARKRKSGRFGRDDKLVAHVWRGLCSK